VALLGAKDLVVVRSGDAVLVADKAHLSELKQLLADLVALPHGQRYL
jgi:hypothetical protein